MKAAERELTIKVERKEEGCEDVDWSDYAHDVDQQLALVNMII
jgi:hypothetical protein